VIRDQLASIQHARLVQKWPERIGNKGTVDEHHGIARTSDLVLDSNAVHGRLRHALQHRVRDRLERRAENAYFAADR
jgi:hypothetical protein